MTQRKTHQARANYAATTGNDPYEKEDAFFTPTPPAMPTAYAIAKPQMKDGKYLFKQRQIVACDDTIASSMNKALTAGGRLFEQRAEWD